MNTVPREADALKAYDDFVWMCQSRYPNVVKCLTGDRDVLFTFQGFQVGHLIQLRTTNSVQSTFATVRLRARRTKG